MDHVLHKILRHARFHIPINRSRWTRASGDHQVSARHKPHPKRRPLPESSSCPKNPQCSMIGPPVLDLLDQPLNQPEPGPEHRRQLLYAFDCEPPVFTLLVSASFAIVEPAPTITSIFMPLFDKGSRQLGVRQHSAHDAEDADLHIEALEYGNNQRQTFTRPIFDAKFDQRRLRFPSVGGQSNVGGVSSEILIPSKKSGAPPRPRRLDDVRSLCRNRQASTHFQRLPLR